MADDGYSRTFLSRNGSPIITHKTYCSLGTGSNWLLLAWSVEIWTNESPVLKASCALNLFYYRF